MTFTLVTDVHRADYTCDINSSTRMHIAKFAHYIYSQTGMHREKKTHEIYYVSSSANNLSLRIKPS